MTTPPDTETALESYSTLTTSGWDEHLARWISRAGSPPLLATAIILLGAQASADQSAWLWAAFYILCVILLPAGYVIWLVQQEKVTDFDLLLREQRLHPLLVAVISAFLAWLVLWFGSAPRLLLLLTGSAWIHLALLLVITLRWKISAHCATAAAFVTFILALFGTIATPLIVVLPLIAWSRLRLRRHDLAQTIAGTFLGSAILGATLYFTA